MSILMTLRVALAALARNKLRTALTALGMIIGVAAVISMVSIGNGARSSVESQISSAGTNLIMVMAGSFTQGGARSGAGNTTTLTEADAQAIQREVSGVRYITPQVNTRAQVVAGNQNWSTSIQGTDVDFPAMRSWLITSGSFFDAADVSRAAKVAVIGTVVRDNLFGAGADPVGETIRIRNEPFRVVGLLASKGQGAMGQDQDDAIYVPYTTVQKKLLGITYVQGITLSAESRGISQQISENVEQLLRSRHRLREDEDDDFTIRTMEELSSILTATTTTMTFLLASIAAVSLLVGGIGIMNIMLVSVTERTREIGLRLALGARGKDVLVQFLVEAIVLSLVGGLAGVALGAAVSQVLAAVMHWPMLMSPGSVGLAFGFSAAIGVFFGFYPARKASALDPIDALRYE
jgi:putative ABC transport system permease protein